MNRISYSRKQRLLLATRRELLRALGVAGTVGLGVFPLRLYAADAGPPIRVGILGPFTGPASSAGEEIRNGVEMAIEEARAAGKLPVLVDGQLREIELVWIDTTSDPEKAVPAVNHALDTQGVEILWGGYHSSVALAVMEVAAERKIVGFAQGGSSTSINDKIHADYERSKGWFKSWPSSQMDANPYARPLQELLSSGAWTPASRKAAVLVEDTDFGRGWGSAIIRSFAEAGFDVLPFDALPPTTTDFAPLILRYRSQGVSLVGLTSGVTVFSANFLKQAREQNLKALLTAHGLTWSSDWYELSGAASDYVLSADSPVALTTEAKAWVERYTAKFGKAPAVTTSGNQYDLVMAGIEVLQKAGTLDYQTIIDTVYTIRYSGLFQMWHWAREAGPNALSANDVVVGDFMEGFFVPMAQFFDGQPKVIYPAKFADQPFQPPPWL